MVSFLSWRSSGTNQKASLPSKVFLLTLPPTPPLGEAITRTDHRRLRGVAHPLWSMWEAAWLYWAHFNPFDWREHTLILLFSCRAANVYKVPDMILEKGDFVLLELWHVRVQNRLGTNRLWPSDFSTSVFLSHLAYIKILTLYIYMS